MVDYLAAARQFHQEGEAAVRFKVESGHYNDEWRAIALKWLDEGDQRRRENEAVSQLRRERREEKSLRAAERSATAAEEAAVSARDAALAASSSNLLAREANEVARDANSLAAAANSLSSAANRRVDKANQIAIGAAVISAISAAAAILALFLKGG